MQSTTKKKVLVSVVSFKNLVLRHQKYDIQVYITGFSWHLELKKKNTERVKENF